MRTILTAGGVAISVGFVVFLISLGLGLQRVSTTQIANLEALQMIDVTVSKSKIISITDEIIEKFKNLPNVLQVEPEISLPSKITLNSSEIDGVVYGKNKELIILEDIKLREGQKYSNESSDAMINTAALNQFGVISPVGQKLSLEYIIKPEYLEKDSKTIRVKKEVKIVGVIEDNSAPFVYIPLGMVKEDGLTAYSGARIKANNKDSVEILKLQLENLGYKVSSIKDTVDQINQFFSIFQVVLMSFGAIAIIIACLGMFNTLTITLLEKTREVGLMKALGTRNKDVYRLFIAESLIIGGLGSAIGLISGLALGYVLNLVIAGFASATGNLAVSIFYTPIYITIFVIVVALVISFLTGLYPSKRAAKLDPLDALRYE